MSRNDTRVVPVPARRTERAGVRPRDEQLQQVVAALNQLELARVHGPAPALRLPQPAA